MKGYPKYVATKQDFINLLTIQEFKAQALDDLKGIRDTQDDAATRVIGTNQDGTDEIETIPNPMPLWKIKGFCARQEVSEMISQHEGVQ